MKLRSKSERFDADVVLTKDEQRVNTTLMYLKQQEYAREVFLPSLPFMSVKNKIENTTLFKHLKKMPKGAVLHQHLDSMLPSEWLVKNASYRPNLYQYQGKFDAETPYGTFKFFKNPPGSLWISVKELRSAAGNVTAFDKSLVELLSTNELAYDASIDYWSKFANFFKLADGLLLYAPVFEDYLFKALSGAVRDNLLSVEVRALGGCVMYDLDRTYSNLESARNIQRISDNVRKLYPQFMGVRIIVEMYRGISDIELETYILGTMIPLRKEVPELVVGMDLVGQEDKGYTLYYFLPALLKGLDEAARNNVTLPFFFHAGETTWGDESGHAADNLFDAVLLSKRIGHGIALAKLPTLMEEVKRKDIALEICPISNQVLQFVYDMRTHPADALMANGVSITISPDDPGPFGYESVVYDWWMAFVAWDADLATLKKLALNSITYSAMSDVEKQISTAIWQQRWDEFVQAVLTE
ncbi:hypothetical protein CYMTET_3441 [Cymbomonas tetramitiformis]|uniref:adenosine deaminase n=1 Tax=Cymbomonas tetramitiformis TaxID=36881 RepID=A0AAE0LL18_9CHLO|nr:hypothetical protein CYMTET_3441 [Cymbomonas tetramitiformis]